ncbi:MAG: glycosyltransferase [Bacteroidaceae bacterium]|nr:glycosyltransferase [Prevotellaceae bacterium]MDY2848694.1 glycosyltransferase [Bacteroidaceae bacterium]
MKFSIIIPIYNVEAYLSSCLDSVFSQGIDDTNFEVVCVNDGSPDNSVEIVKHYMSEHNNIVLLNQVNQGVSIARNNGLAHAKGDYVLFLDSDDKIFSSSLKSLSAEIEKSIHTDIMICNFVREGRYSYCWHETFQAHKLYSSGEMLNGGLLQGSVMGICFDRNFLLNNGVCFLDGIKNGEDTNFMLQCLFNAKSIQFFDIDLYEVVLRSNSASRVFSKSRIDCMIDSVKRVYLQREELIKQDGNRMVLDYMIYTMFLNLIKDSMHTSGLGYWYLLKSGVGKYSKFKLSPDTHFLRNKMLLLTKSFSAFYFSRKIMSIVGMI